MLQPLPDVIGSIQKMSGSEYSNLCWGTEGLLSHQQAAAAEDANFIPPAEKLRSARVDRQKDLQPGSSTAPDLIHHLKSHSAPRGCFYNYYSHICHNNNLIAALLQASKNTKR